MIVFDTLVDTLFLDGIQHSLKFADQQHIVISSDKTVLAVELELLLKIALILVDGNGREVDSLFLPQFFWIER